MTINETPSQEEILEQIRSLLGEMFDVDPKKVTMESHLVTDLDLDSIDAIDMVVKLQDMTGKRVEEDLLRKLRTIGDVVNLVHAQLLAQAAESTQTDDGARAIED